jgi:hypothetical protein
MHFFRLGLGKVFYFHSSFRGKDQNRPALHGVYGDAEVHFAGYVHGPGDEQKRATLAAYGHAQNCRGRFPQFLFRRNNPYAAGFAAAACEYLSLDHNGVAEFRGRLRRFVRRSGRFLRGPGDARPGEKLLSLIFQHSHDASPDIPA